MHQAQQTALTLLLVVTSIGVIGGVYYAVHWVHQGIDYEKGFTESRCATRGLVPMWADGLGFCMDPRTRALFAP